VVVVGSANFDQIVRTEALPSTFETQIGHGYRSGVGGKGANQALMAAKLGARVSMVCKLGMDAHAERIVATLRDNGVDCGHVLHDPNLETGMALMIVDRSGHHGMVLNPGANLGLSAADVGRAAGLIMAARVLLVQLEVPQETTLAALRLCAGRGTIAVLRPAPVVEAGAMSPELFALPDVVVLTEGDFGRLRARAGLAPTTGSRRPSPTEPPLAAGGAPPAPRTDGGEAEPARDVAAAGGGVPEAGRTTQEKGPFDDGLDGDGVRRPGRLITRQRTIDAANARIMRDLRALLRRYRCKRMVLMRHGMAFVASRAAPEEEAIFVVPKTQRAVDFTGAAGCFVGSFAFFLAQGEAYGEAARHAAELCSSVQW
jgi:ribokinase